MGVRMSGRSRMGALVRSLMLLAMLPSSAVLADEGPAPDRPRIGEASPGYVRCGDGETKRDVETIVLRQPVKALWLAGQPQTSALRIRRCIMLDTESFAVDKQTTPNNMVLVDVLDAVVVGVRYDMLDLSAEQTRSVERRAIDAYGKADVLRRGQDGCTYRGWSRGDEIVGMSVCPGLVEDESWIKISRYDRRVMDAIQDAVPPSEAGKTKSPRTEVRGPHSAEP